MIPLFAVIGWRTQRGRKLRLWLPLFLLWLLLLPLVLVLLPFAIIGCLLLSISPWRFIATGWNLLTGLRGMQLELDHIDHYLTLHVI